MKTAELTENRMALCRNTSKGHRIIGGTIAVIGFFWFAKKIGWIPLASGGLVYFWPLVTLIAGIAILCLGRGSRNKKTNTRKKLRR